MGLEWNRREEHMLSVFSAKNWGERKGMTAVTRDEKYKENMERQGQRGACPSPPHDASAGLLGNGKLFCVSSKSGQQRRSLGH